MTDNTLQNKLLDELINDRILVTVFMMNGFQTRGILLAYDDTVIAFSQDGKQQIFYKHAISAIAPMRSLRSLCEV